MKKFHTPILYTGLKNEVCDIRIVFLAGCSLLIDKRGREGLFGLCRFQAIGLRLCVRLRTNKNNGSRIAESHKIYQDYIFRAVFMPLGMNSVSAFLYTLLLQGS